MSVKNRKDGIHFSCLGKGSKNFPNSQRIIKFHPLQFFRESTSGNLSKKILFQDFPEVHCMTSPIRSRMEVK
ncbi:hypothetical protein DLM75_20240 [Leptospira stimsonii]|uniref:Uncharacterized protein n=1 Tax=Leptospira stimsonii TaxID=2202203 RepID=A0A396YRI9_9LEPT|nr:hypothetical protein DLM75_20240 [Leptospira stimsonii]